MKKILCFSATWCGPCRTFAPIFEEVSKKYATKFTFQKIDVDEDEQLCDKYKVQSIPTIIVVDGEKEILRKVGSFDSQGFQNWLDSTN